MPHILEMKRIIIPVFAIAMAFPASAGNDLPAHFDAGAYRLAWSDEFDGTALDRDTWNVEDNGTGCGNNELQYYIDSPTTVSVADGCLVLTARRQNYGDSHKFVSGRVNSCGKKSFTYGIVEAAIKLSATSDGLWPAFWMMGNDINVSGWPACGECDILEMGHADGIASGNQTKLFNGAVHYGPDAAHHHQQVGVGQTEYSLQDGEFHHFYAVWTPESICMYVDTDPKPYFVLDIRKNAVDGPDSTGNYFHKPAFLLFNLAVGGDFTGIHDPAAVTALSAGEGSEASMLVDYVRIYAPADVADNNE